MQAVEHAAAVSSVVAVAAAIAGLFVYTPEQYIPLRDTTAEVRAGGSCTPRFAHHPAPPLHRVESSRFTGCCWVFSPLLV